MSMSARAKSIQKQHGTFKAARFLRNKGFGLGLAMFILTGKFPPKGVV